MSAHAHAAGEHDQLETVIEPPRGLQYPAPSEVWDRRDLLYYLVRRDFLVRYKQTVAGPLWAILQPIGMAVVFSVFLGALANVPSRAGIEYPVFALSGLTMWLFISKALQNGAESTVSSADLLAKIYFPRVLVPLAALISAAADFVVAQVVVIAALLVYGESLHWTLLALPVVTVFAMAVALGGALWFAALFVRYRDIRHILSFVLLAGMFVTPVVYPFSLIPDHLQWLYSLNPFVGVIEFYRWSLFGHLGAPLGVLLIPVAVSIVTIISGAFYFRAAESTFADVI